MIFRREGDVYQLAANHGYRGDIASGCKRQIRSRKDERR